MSPGMTIFGWQARNARTMSGSNWLPEQRRISAIASETGSAFRYAGGDHRVEGVGGTSPFDGLL